MLVSYKWLTDLIDIKDVSPIDLADRMSRTGIEVEEVVVPEEGLKKIVVGDVKECIPHPNSDHLFICQVDVGEEELSQIVCGAPNIEAGKKVIVALPNSRITGNVKIKKGKMRGEVSLGMICSLQELGYSDSVIPKAYSEGIYFLPDDAIPGEPVFSYLDMDDAIIELSVTPNRADALSLRGVAHEVGAIYNRVPSFSSVNLKENTTEKVSDYLTGEVTNESDVPSYRLRVIKDVKVTESPLWLQTRLMNEGIRPINNVVDATNYTLLLYGQPQHAFDYDKIGSKKISVRRGRENESLETLDQVSRDLSDKNIVITNGEKAIALAGVMGGFETEITEDTKTVVLETALFDPIVTRRTARSFGLSSESSKRFERGINVDTLAEASAFTAQLIAELGQGEVVSGEYVSKEVDTSPVVLSIALDRLNHLLGTKLTQEEVTQIFIQLGFGVSETEGVFTVSIPRRRWDISIEADLVEEVARIYGYDNLPSTLPSGNSLPGKLSAKQQQVRNIRRHLEGHGLNEAISYALMTPELAQNFTWNNQDITTLSWPMSEEHSVLRQSLSSGLLKNVAYNVARKAKTVAFYEIGHVFGDKTEEGLPTETTHLGFAMTGAWKTNDWQSAEEAIDFYTLKGILESLFDSLGVLDSVRYDTSHSMEELHPGRSAFMTIDEQVIGFIGQVHPLTAKSMDLPKDVFVAELNLDVLYDLVPKEIIFKEVGKYPTIKRDMALLADKETNNQLIMDVIEKHGGKYLVDIHLFDLFIGEKLGHNKKSLAYSLLFRNDTATLIDEDVTKVMTAIEQALVEELEIEVR